MRLLLIAAVMAVSMSQAIADGRPPECRGIPWCACWLRHQLGLSDRKYNRAFAFLGYGHATDPHVGAIGVMKRSHVGIVVGHCSGGVLLKSGNTWGRNVVNGVGTACYALSQFKGFRG